MTKKKTAGKKTAAPKAAPAKNALKGWVFWTPRILSIVFILFISIFSLDVFDSGYGFPMVLLAVLLIAWRYELVGAVVFGLFGILYIVLTIIRTNNGDQMAMYGWVIINCLIIAGPAFLVAWLFYKGWREKRASA
jgi:hypothetical protein